MEFAIRTSEGFHISHISMGGISNGQSDGVLLKDVSEVFYCTAKPV